MCVVQRSDVYIVQARKRVYDNAASKYYHKVHISIAIVLIRSHVQSNDETFDGWRAVFKSI